MRWSRALEALRTGGLSLMTVEDDGPESVSVIASKLDDWADELDAGRPGPSSSKLRRYARELRGNRVAASPRKAR